MDYSWAKFAKEPRKKHRKITVSEDTYQKVFKACEGKCMLCGTRKNLELHHIMRAWQRLNKQSTKLRNALPLLPSRRSAPKLEKI